MSWAYNKNVKPCSVCTRESFSGHQPTTVGPIGTCVDPIFKKTTLNFTGIYYT